MDWQQSTYTHSSILERLERSALPINSPETLEGYCRQLVNPAAAMVLWHTLPQEEFKCKLCTKYWHWAFCSVGSKSLSLVSVQYVNTLS